MRVVQTDPGPIPTLMMSAPDRISSSTISPVTTLPAYRTTTTVEQSEPDFKISKDFWVWRTSEGQKLKYFVRPHALIKTPTNYCDNWQKKWQLQYCQACTFVNWVLLVCGVTRLVLGLFTNENKWEKPHNLQLLNLRFKKFDFEGVSSYCKEMQKNVPCTISKQNI